MQAGNTVSVIGNATKDAELRTTQSGRTVCRFGIAWNDRRKTADGQWEDAPNFFDVTVWLTDNQARAFEGRILKGCKVAIVGGILRQHSWEQDGQRRSAVEIVVNDPFASLCIEPRQQRGGYQQPQQQYQQPQQGYRQQTQQQGLYDEDIPF